MELEVLRAQNIALRKSLVVDGSVVRDLEVLGESKGHRGIVKTSGTSVPLKRSELVTRLQIENQELKMSLLELNGNMLLDDTSRSESFKPSIDHDSLKGISDGLRLVVQRQHLDIRNLQGNEPYISAG